ncbi:hypothetical protein Trydic_g153 [Trypoxylus dichotomus]
MALLNSVIFFSVIAVVLSHSFAPSKQAFLLRERRGTGSSATAYSSASASASSSSGGGGGAPINFSGYVPNFADTGYGLGDNFPSQLPPGAQIYSRFGEEEGTGVLASGAAQGAKGAFSSTLILSSLKKFHQ